ncbi:hypothetical protein AMTRI_Chr13g88790 [Amborella trichopoda]
MGLLHDTLPHIPYYILLHKPRVKGHHPSDVSSLIKVYLGSNCEASKHSMQLSKHALTSIRPYIKEVYHSSSCEASKHSMQSSKHAVASIKPYIKSKHAPAFIKPYIKEVYHSSNCEALKHNMHFKACAPLYKAISQRGVPQFRL